MYWCTKASFLTPFWMIYRLFPKSTKNGYERSGFWGLKEIHGLNEVRCTVCTYLLRLNWVKKTYLFDVIWHDLSVTVDIMCLQFGHDVLQHCYKVLILKVILVKWFMLFSPWVAQIFGSFGRDWTGSLWFSAKADCSKAWWCGFNERFSTKM